MHHCIADGIALARVMLSLTDAQPDAGIEPAEPEQRRPRRGQRLLGVVAAPATRASAGARRSAAPCPRGGRGRPRTPPSWSTSRRRPRDDAKALGKLLLSGPDASTVLKGELGRRAAGRLVASRSRSTT